MRRQLGGVWAPAGDGGGAAAAGVAGMVNGPLPLLFFNILGKAHGIFLPAAVLLS